MPVQTFLQTKVRAFRVFGKKIGIYQTLLYSWRRLTYKTGALIPINLKGLNTFYVRNKFYDTKILLQIFVNEELNFPLAFRPDVIIDCGANIGLATLYFKRKFPEAKIICVEPEDSNFALLQRNTKSYQGVTVVQKGIWKKRADLFIIDNGEGNASFQVSENGVGQNVIAKIKTVSLDSLLGDYGLSSVDLIKMDIEGAEKPCFESTERDWIDRTRCLAVEIHEDIHPGCKSIIDEAMPAFAQQRSGEYHIYTKI